MQTIISPSHEAPPEVFSSAVGRDASPSRTIDQMLMVPASELEHLYRTAKVPRLEDVRGDLHGRMLAWPMLASHPRIAGALRAFAGAAAFPWNGKTFVAPSERGREESHGEGINRVFSERARLFRFETFIGKSRAGDFDALQLDYDVPGNPPVIRSIKDEIREIEPGVWLGQAYLQTSKRDLLWLYFGLAVRSRV